MFELCRWLNYDILQDNKSYPQVFYYHVTKSISAIVNYMQDRSQLFSLSPNFDQLMWHN